MAGRKKSMARKPRKRAEAPAFEETYGRLWIPVVLFFVLLAGLAVFYVWERIRFGELNRDIIELELARQEILEENSRLRAQVEELSSFRRISKIAEKHFGFVVLKPRIIVVEEEDE